MDIPLEFLTFFNNWTNVVNVVSCTLPLKKTSFFWWEFSFQMLTESLIHTVQQHFACMWNEGNCPVVFPFCSVFLLGSVRNTDFFHFSSQVFQHDRFCYKEAISPSSLVYPSVSAAHWKFRLSRRFVSL